MSEAVERLAAALHDTAHFGWHLWSPDGRECPDGKLDADAWIEKAAVFIERNPALAEAIELGLSWQAAEAALPEGWRPLTVEPPDPDGYDEAGQAITDPWEATTCSMAFFDGENDTEWALGTGATPAEALRNLAAKLNP